MKTSARSSASISTSWGIGQYYVFIANSLSQSAMTSTTSRRKRRYTSICPYASPQLADTSTSNFYFFFLSFEAPFVLAVPRTVFALFLRCLPKDELVIMQNYPSRGADMRGTYAAVCWPFQSWSPSQLLLAGNVARISSLLQMNRI